MDARTIGNVALHESDTLYNALDKETKLLFRNKTEFRRLFSLSLRYWNVLNEVENQIIFLKKEELNQERKIRGQK